MTTIVLGQRSMLKRRSTTIRVLGATWQVPRGFGRAYVRAVADDLSCTHLGRSEEADAAIVDLLALVGYATTPVQVALWDLPRRVEAVVWAGTEVLRASDNPIQRHPALAWLPDPPWQGPPPGEGTFSGPTGTLVR